MFDISALKNMKLSELQDIAKLAKTIKFAGVKKEDLITQILEQQASSSVEVNSSSSSIRTYLFWVESNDESRLLRCVLVYFER